MNGPKGVIAILTGPDGHVYACAHDFKDGAKEAQEQRARCAMAWNLVEQGCSPWIAKAMRSYQMAQLVDVLCQEQGFQKTVKYVGYDEEGR